MGVDDRNRMRAMYDDMGEREWERLERDPQNRVALEIHKRFLKRFVRSGDHVLEIGAGPGRFTLELALIGATVDVTDFSPVQLELHRDHIGNTTAENAVLSRAILDICDTSIYPDATFDAVLAYGGPLSYAFEQAQDALEGLFRITKPGGYVVASVMSTLGAWRRYFPAVVEDANRTSWEASDAVFNTGDLRPFQTAHICKMFRSREIAEMVRNSGAELIAMSASNWASLEDPDVLSELESHTENWAQFLNQEESACLESGTIDGGTHILFAARR